MTRPIIVLTALQGAAAVALAAWAAHGLEAAWGARTVQSVQTATQMVLLHLPAVLALVAAAAAVPARRRPVLQSAALLCLGALVFSAALYGLAFGGPGLLGAVAPVGGLLLILGWLSLLRLAR